MSGPIDSQSPSLVWLDQSPTESDEHVYTRQQLSKFDEQLKVFSCANECETHIRNQPPTASITLIVSGALGKELVPKIHELSQIKCIHVYCQIRLVHEAWACNHNKIKGVVVTFPELCQLLQSSYTNVLPSDTTSVIASKGEQSAADTVQTNAAVTASPQPESPDAPCTYSLDLWYHISENCFDCISRTKWQPNAINDFISICQDTFKNNEEFLSIVGEFSTSYADDKATSYLYRHPAFCQMLDFFFKTVFIDGMIASRVFLHDVCKQFAEHKCTLVVEVYRCEVMSNEQFRLLQEMKGKTIAMKHFFPTNASRQKALSYVPTSGSPSECKRILYTIDADPQVANSKPFAKIGSLGNYDDPDGVVFLIGSLFKVTEIEDEKDGIINIKLTLCVHDEGDEAKAYFDQIKQKYIDKNGEMDIVGFGQFLRELGRSAECGEISSSGDKIIRDHHEKLDPGHSDHSRCCLVLGEIALSEGDHDTGLAWYEKAFVARRSQPARDDSDLIDHHNAVAFTYCDKNAPEKALDHFNAVLSICKKSTGENDVSLIPCYSNLAMVHEMQNQLAEAFAFLSQAERIAVKQGITNELVFATLCHNMGNIRTALDQYYLALGYYQTSLKIKLKLLSPTDPSIVSVYKSLGYVYTHLEDTSHARAMYEKAVELHRQVQPEGHATMTELEELIRNLPRGLT